MALRLYADECVDGRIVAGLTRRGVDVVTAGSLGLLGASDKEQLAQAVELGRVPVRADHDFLRLAHARIGAGASFHGLIFILPGAPRGRGRARGRAHRRCPRSCRLRRAHRVGALSRCARGSTRREEGSNQVEQSEVIRFPLRDAAGKASRLFRPPRLV